MLDKFCCFSIISLNRNEGTAADQHLEQQDSDCPTITFLDGVAIFVARNHHLRRHVMDIACLGVPSLVLVFKNDRVTEVNQPELIHLRQHYVCGFQIPMHDELVF